MPQSGRVVFSKMDEVVFGRPVAEAVADQAQRLAAARVFLLVSGTLNRETREIENIRKALGSRHAGTFDAMLAHTPRSCVVAAAEQARDAKADLMVTIGGGSVTDGAKAVQLCLANDVRSAEALDALRPVKGADGTVGPPPCRPPALPHVAVPTTLSAAEFSAIAGVTNEQTKTKELFRHPGIIPRAVILDPAITTHTPERLFISTGIRALDHCVEGICSSDANPYGDAQALQGLKLLAHGLPGVKADPENLAARLDALLGAWLSMGPLSTGVPMGASHGIGYVLGALFGVPHGETSCIMLPAVMRWNKPANSARQDLVSAAMNHAGEDAGDVLDRFIGALGMPRSLGAVGIGPERFDVIAAAAMHTPWVPRNPRRIDAPAQVREILELAA
jgi:maleylacetate reductase